MKNEIAREVSAILSKEYGGSGKRSFQLARSIVKLVVDRIEPNASDTAVVSAERALQSANDAAQKAGIEIS
jgi:hypothetical protein